MLAYDNEMEMKNEFDVFSVCRCIDRKWRHKCVVIIIFCCCWKTFSMFIVRASNELAHPPTPHITIIRVMSAQFRIWIKYNLHKFSIRKPPAERVCVRCVVRVSSGRIRQIDSTPWVLSVGCCLIKCLISLFFISSYALYPNLTKI